MERDDYHAFLSEKPALLTAPGSLISNLYYNKHNSSIEAVQSTTMWSNKINLPSTSFGASNIINLPMNMFIGQLVLRLRLPQVVANQTVALGWGLAMISQIRFQMGTSSSTPIIMTGKALWHYLMAQCPTEEKRSQLLQFCGLGWTQPSPTNVPSGQSYIEAFVPISAPFSSLCEKLFFDTTLIGQPITIFIDFVSSAKAIYGGSAAAPTGFIDATLMMRNMNLADAGKSLRNVLNADPKLIYSYPFTMALGFEVSSTFTGIQEGDGQVTVQFNQFQNGDLTGIVFCVQNVTDLSPSGVNAANPFHLDPITNVVVTYNGGSIFQLPGAGYAAVATYMGDQQASNYQNVTVVVGGGGTQFTPTNQNEFLVFLDFSQVRQACMQDHLVNTWRIPPGNVLTVQFNTSQGSGQTYRCFYTCFYNAVVAVQDGTTNILVN